MRYLWLTLLVAFLSLPSRAESPQAMVERLYRDWFHRQARDPVDFFAARQNLFEPSLVDRVKRSLNLDPDKDGTFFDCDALTGRQEELLSFWVGPARQTDQECTVDVSLRIGPRQGDSDVTTVRVVLRPWSRGWRVHDIVYNDKESLSKTCDELLYEAHTHPR